jgi:hypothetical protein
VLGVDLCRMVDGVRWCLAFGGVGVSSVWLKLMADTLRCSCHEHGHGTKASGR